MPVLVTLGVWADGRRVVLNMRIASEAVPKPSGFQTVSQEQQRPKTDRQFESPAAPPTRRAANRSSQ